VRRPASPHLAGVQGIPVSANSLAPAAGRTLGNDALALTARETFPTRAAERSKAEMPRKKPARARKAAGAPSSARQKLSGNRTRGVTRIRRPLRGFPVQCHPGGLGDLSRTSGLLSKPKPVRLAPPARGTVRWSSAICACYSS
jgi:hypothetical protein